MRIMIGLHHVVLGGDTINALELACRLRTRGHDVTLFAFCEPGATVAPLLELAARRSVHVEVFPRAAGVVERLRVVRALATYARREGVQLVHSFGHQDTYFSFVATYGLVGIPLVVNDYQMALTQGLPRRVPLVVGTGEVLDQARRERPGRSYLVEPPVDVAENRPDAVDGAAFRRRCGVSGELLVVIVSRLARSMKFESLRATIDAMADLPGLRLAMVGDGAAMPELTVRAEAVNARAGCEAIVLTGAMLDPRPAYAAADIVVGMGHSGLRGMAFGKPVVIVGEEGFVLPVAVDTLDHVRYHGVYGVGDGGDAAPALAAHLRELASSPVLRAERGALGRSFVVDRFGLDSAADRLDAIYASARRRSTLDWTRDLAYLAGTYAPAKWRRVVTARPPMG